MQLAKLDKIKKYYGDRLILDIDKFEIIEGDRIGLVGENGAGKTTLLKMLLGTVEAEEGEGYLTRSYSYISQMEQCPYECEGGKVNKLFNAPNKYEEFLSGGEKVKIKISKALSENKSLIIADEPTSNLDSKSVKVLEDMLKSYNGALLLVSHDRQFLDALCNTIVEIEDGKINVYKGNYSKYLELKSEERKREEFEHDKYLAEKRRLENCILEKQELKNSIRKTPKRMGNSEARLHRKMGGQRAKKNLDGNIKALRSRIDHLEVKEKPKTIGEIKIKVQDSMKLISKYPIYIDKLSLFVENKLLLKEATFRIKRGRKVAIIGDNGCGKSTLLKKILEGNNDNIKVSNRVVIGYFDQMQSILKEDKSILENIQENCSYDQSFIRINLDGFGFKGNDVYKVVNSLSGGEKVKVAICKTLLSENNVLILDEPTNYLDIKSMESLERALINTDKTVIIVCHDRKFISNVCDYFIEIKDKQVKEFDGSYTDCINENNKTKANKVEKENKEQLLILQNKLSELISLLSIERNEEKKRELDCEYFRLLKDIRHIQKNNKSLC